MANHENRIVIPLLQRDYIHHGKLEVICRLVNSGSTLAQVKGALWEPTLFDPSTNYPGKLYFVPVFPLLKNEAASLGISDRNDFYGGMAEREHQTLKGITHPLVSVRAASPPGWNHTFPDVVASATLPGYTAFSDHDAEEARKLLQKQGHEVRVKRTKASRGNDQTIVDSPDDLNAALANIPQGEVNNLGVVLEANLQDRVIPVTVGQVDIDEQTFSFYGKVRQTQDIAGNRQYGGGDIFIARGGFTDLRAHVMDPDVQPIEALTRSQIDIAIRQAEVFDANAQSILGIERSRVSYGLMQSETPAGEIISGVTDISLRFGGWSAFEARALRKFQADRDQQFLRGSTRNIFIVPPQENISVFVWDRFEEQHIPPNGIIFYRGNNMDGNAGLQLSYTTLDTDTEPVTQVRSLHGTKLVMK